MSKRAVYAGSFAPVHLGHIYVLEQACALFDEVHILLASNIQKKSSRIDQRRSKKYRRS